LFHVGQRARNLQCAENLHESQHGPKQPEQRRDLSKRGEHIELLLEAWHFHQAGLFRFHQPKAFRGMELDFVAVVDITAEVARGCPSTAWNVGNLACHHWILGYYDPETQHEVWDANPDALIASSIALAAGRGRKTDGGFIVSGRWPFSSGVDNSDWNMLAVTVYGDDGKTPIDWRLCLVPKTDYEIIDTWYAMGMAATGRQVQFQGVTIVRIEQGKLMEGWNTFNQLEMFQQLGVVNLPLA